MGDHVAAVFTDRTRDARITDNHRCASIDQLVKEVDDCLQALSPYLGSPASLRPVLSSPVADSGSAI